MTHKKAKMKKRHRDDLPDELHMEGKQKNGDEVKESADDPPFGQLSWAQHGAARTLPNLHSRVRAVKAPHPPQSRTSGLEFSPVPIPPSLMFIPTGSKEKEDIWKGVEVEEQTEDGEEEEKEDEAKDGQKKPAATKVHEMSLAELEQCLQALKREMASVAASKADLSACLAGLEVQIADITTRTTLIQALVQIRKDNARLAEEANRAQDRKAETEEATAQVRRELEALSLERDQCAEELERIKEEKVEIKQLAAKKKEVEDLASELESRKEAADALRARLEEAETQLAADRASLQEERDALAAERLKMTNLQEFASRRVKLNVGGTHFQTSLSTLTQVPSMFSAMFSGKYRMDADEDGCYFIDRDPTHFRYVLNFLRDSRIEVPAEGAQTLVRELLTEAEFYQVDGLIALLMQNAEGSGSDRSPASATTNSPSPSSFAYRFTGSSSSVAKKLPENAAKPVSTVSSSTTRVHFRPGVDVRHA